jgi:hypothetical protein
MNKTHLLILVVLAVILVMAVPARGQSGSFLIQNADGSNTLSLSPSAALTSLIGNVASRFTIQYANEKSVIAINPPPTGLTSLLLQTADRFILQYANQKNVIQIGYPLKLVNDQAAPQIEGVTVQPAGGGDLTLTIVANEYTRCSLAYGAASGNYTQTLQDDLYRYTHQFSLTGLAPGQTYYYQVSITDRSGNIFTSPEASVSAQIPLFIPLIIH